MCHGGMQLFVTSKNLNVIHNTFEVIHVVVVDNINALNAQLNVHMCVIVEWLHNPWATGSNTVLSILSMLVNVLLVSRPGVRTVKKLSKGELKLTEAGVFLLCFTSRCSDMTCL